MYDIIKSNYYKNKYLLLKKGGSLKFRETKNEELSELKIQLEELSELKIQLQVKYKHKLDLDKELSQYKDFKRKQSEPKYKIYLDIYDRRTNNNREIGTLQKEIGKKKREINTLQTEIGKKKRELTKSKFTESERIESECMESKITESEFKESKITENECMESKRIESERIESKITESKITESEFKESEFKESEFKESKRIESKIKKTNSVNLLGLGYTLQKHHLLIFTKESSDILVINNLYNTTVELLKEYLENIFKDEEIIEINNYTTDNNYIINADEKILEQIKIEIFFYNILLGNNIYISEKKNMIIVLNLPKTFIYVLQIYLNSKLQKHYDIEHDIIKSCFFIYDIINNYNNYQIFFTSSGMIDTNVLGRIFYDFQKEYSENYKNIKLQNDVAKYYSEELISIKSSEYDDLKERACDDSKLETTELISIKSSEYDDLKERACDDSKLETTELIPIKSSEYDDLKERACDDSILETTELKNTHMKYTEQNFVSNRLYDEKDKISELKTNKSNDINILYQNIGIDSIIPLYPKHGVDKKYQNLNNTCSEDISEKIKNHLFNLLNRGIKYEVDFIIFTEFCVGKNLDDKFNYDNILYLDSLLKDINTNKNIKYKCYLYTYKRKNNIYVNDNYKSFGIIYNNEKWELDLKISLQKNLLGCLKYNNDEINNIDEYIDIIISQPKIFNNICFINHEIFNVDTNDKFMISDCISQYCQIGSFKNINDDKIITLANVHYLNYTGEKIYNTDSITMVNDKTFANLDNPHTITTFKDEQKSTKFVSDIVITDIHTDSVSSLTKFNGGSVEKADIYKKSNSGVEYNSSVEKAGNPIKPLSGVKSNSGTEQDNRRIKSFSGVKSVSPTISEVYKQKINNKIMELDPDIILGDFNSRNHKNITSSEFNNIYEENIIYIEKSSSLIELSFSDAAFYKKSVLKPKRNAKIVKNYDFYKENYSFHYAINFNFTRSR